MLSTPLPPLISSGKAARLLSVHVSTVNRLIRSGQLTVQQRTPGGHARLSYADVLALRDSLRIVNAPGDRGGSSERPA